MRPKNLTKFAAISSAALCLPLAIGFLGAWHPALDSFSHFRAHLAIILIIVSFLTLVVGYRKVVGLSLAVGLCAVATTTSISVLPLRTYGAAVDVKAAASTYRFLQLNVLFNNETPEAVVSMIIRTQPDVVTLNEVSRKWAPHLQRMRATYPYMLTCVQQRGVGPVAILSRWPFAAGEQGICYDDGSMAKARINLNGSVVTVAALHLKWPWPFGQPRHVDRLMEPLTQLGETAIVAGDLNAVPWSFAVSRIAKAGGLVQISGSTPTWPSRSMPVSWRKWLGLPIDNVFARGAIVIHSTTTLEDVGSDHVPLLVEFSL